jgi:hypothetical protein
MLLDSNGSVPLVWKRSGRSDFLLSLGGATSGAPCAQTLPEVAGAPLALTDVSVEVELDSKISSNTSEGAKSKWFNFGITFCTLARSSRSMCRGRQEGHRGQVRHDLILCQLLQHPRHGG